MEREREDNSILTAENNEMKETFKQLVKVGFLSR